MMKRYKAYKDSGIGWIGEIPEHWEVRQFKRVFADVVEKGHPNEPCLCATQKYGVIPQSMYENRVVVVNKGFENLKLVRKGNFVISLRSFQGGIEMAHYQGIISAAYTILQLNENYLIPEYARYLLKSYDFVQLLKICVTGIREGQNIDYQILKKQILPLPPLAEQEAIVAYLDEKTRKIDEYINERTKELNLLSELRQAEIAHAVTHGLNPNAPMKPSGIPWIGQIPEHWSKDKTMRLFSQIGSGTTPQGDDCYEGGTIPWINSGDLNDGLVSETKKKVTPNALKRYSTLKLYDAHSIIIAMYGATIGKVGLSQIPACTNQACCVLNGIADTLNEAYAFYVYLSCKSYWLDKAKGGTQPNINADVIKQTWLPLPPLAEQEAIVAYLDEKTAQIDTMIDGLQKQIDYIKEYRQTLIADVVTGRVNVTE